MSAFTSCKGQLKYNEPLAHYTSWRVGGVAKQLYKPYDCADLQYFLQQLPIDESVQWLGLGSNSLIRDGGIHHTVIVTQAALMHIELIPPSQVKVEAGVSCATMARFCARNNLSGAEFWAGIPGTMGGALRMNAGCDNGQTWDYVTTVETIDRHGVIRIRSPADFTIAYRHVILPKDEWFMRAIFQLQPGNKAIALETIKRLLDRRAQTQPTSEYNCGSVFKNPPGDYAARLIEACGLKGKQLGGAMVSTKHANFIINQAGKAYASEIEALIQFVQKTVHAQHNIVLIPEVHIMGEHYG